MGMNISKENFLLSALYEDAHRELNPDDDDCPDCGGEGYLLDECTCGEDTCCCAEPEPPRCIECARFEAKIERYVLVQILRVMDVPLTRAWAVRRGRWERVHKASDSRVLLELHAGRAGCKDFTEAERTASACWVECLI